MFRAGVFSVVCTIAAATASGQTVLNGISFLDRNQTREVVLGAYRGPIAVIDYDEDGYPDLIIGDSPGRMKRLFHNVPDGGRPGARTFVDATIGSGIDEPDGTARDAVGIVVGDYDNDGHDDIYMIGRGPNFGVLYHNDGSGHFTNVTAASGIRFSGGGTPESASWCDYDLDGNLDLFVIGNSAPNMVLFRNNGNGTFSNASNLLPAIQSVLHFYSHTWLDYDGDGWPDAFPITSSGAGHDVVLHNVSDGQGGRQFVNVASQIGFVGLGNAPMGIALGDFDGDGDLDIGIADAIVGTYFRNDGGVFTRITPFATMFGWGVDWIDVDNDKLLDFFTAGSWGSANFDNLQRNLGGGVFANYSATLNGASLATQYAVQVDLNNDGRQDIIAVNPNNSVSIYENASTTPNHWLRVRLRGNGGVNRDAVGAIVRVTSGGVTQMRALVSGSATTATEDMRLHFGLGGDAAVDRIEVTWPRNGSLASRTERFLGPIAADQTIVLSPATSVLAGDLNCDGALNAADVASFVQALLDPPAYAAANLSCNISNADINGDGVINGADVQPLLQSLFGG